MASIDCNTLGGFEAWIVKRAVGILDRKLRRKSGPLSSPNVVRQYLAVRYALAPREVFSALFLDAQNRVIAVEELFHGTICRTDVHPREVVKAALQHNAVSVMLVHNHPSGVAEPSYADETLTRALCEALDIVGVKVLDHFIVGGTNTLSFAERGLMGGAAEVVTTPVPKTPRKPRKKRQQELDFNSRA